MRPLLIFMSSENDAIGNCLLEEREPVWDLSQDPLGEREGSKYPPVYPALKALSGHPCYCCLTLEETRA